MGMTAGMVAAGHPETAAAGQAVLEAGGNAFDAALGALCAATVCEPLLTSLAGGGFLLARPAGREPEVFDFFVQTPQQKRPVEEIDFAPVLVDFGPAQQEFHVGLGAAAVPGLAAGIFAVHEALGVLPMAEVMAPAIDLARNGVTQTPYQAFITGILKPILERSPEAMALVSTPDTPGSPAQAGQRVLHEDLSELLSFMAREGRAGFYQGEPGQKLVRDCREQGGLLTRADLDAYEVVRRRPIHVASHGAECWFNAPPSPAGCLVAFALGMLDQLDVSPEDWGSVRGCLAMLGSMDAANRLRAEMLSDKLDESMAAQMLSDEQLESWRAQAVPSDLFRRGTTHISVADKDGNFASLTSSNGEGCGYVIPGTGIMVNNMLGEEDLNPDGFHRWQADTRLASMMCPTLVRLADGSEVALGTGGSNRIRSAVLQVLVNLCCYDMDLERAVSAPRMHLEGGSLDFEAGLDEAVEAELLSRWPGAKAWPGTSLFFGGVHAVQRFSDGRFSGVGDPRRGGAVLQAKAG